MPERPTAAFAACLEAAHQAAPAMMRCLGDRAVERLRMQGDLCADKLQREQLGTALRLLMREQFNLERQFPGDLRTMIDQAQRPQAETRTLSALRFEDLELMGEEQVNEKVELARTQQATLAAVEHQLGEFNGLISAALGLPYTQPDRNPLRPETYVQALRATVARFPVDPVVRLIWLQSLGESLGDELKTFYEQRSQAFKAQGIRVGGFNVINRGGATAGGASSGNAGAAGVQGASGRGTFTGGGANMPESPGAGWGGMPPVPGATPGAPGIEASQLLNLRLLHQLLTTPSRHAPLPDPGRAAAWGAGSAWPTLGETAFPAFGPVASAPAPYPGAEANPSFDHTVPAALDALAGMEQVESLIDRLPRPRTAPGTAGASASRDWAIELSAEVVRIMIERIAGDTRLLPDIREAVKALQAPLIRLAGSDPRFFSEHDHPARQLLEVITQRGLPWRSTEEPGYAAFLGPLMRTVVRLSESADRTEDFAEQLTRLQKDWAAHEAHERQQREQAVQALLLAEQRQVLAEKLAAEFAVEPSAHLLPHTVKAFLAGPWAQVVAHARLSDTSGSSDPGGYHGAVRELMWSVLPVLAGRNKARLVRTVPNLVNTLRSGLALIAYPEAQVQAFLDALAVMHDEILRPSGMRRAPQAQPISREELDRRFDAQATQPWLAPQEAQHSGFMDESAVLADSVSAQTTEERPHAGDVQPPSDEAGQATLPMAQADFEVGQWFELHIEGQWRRVQLIWRSPQGRLFMFSGMRGSNHSMSRRALEAGLQAGTVRWLSEHSLVDGALDAVTQTALRNSVDRR